MDLVAHVRLYESSRQCELMFNLYYKSLQNLEITVSRVLTDSVSDLINEIRSSITQTVLKQIINNEENCIESHEDDIVVSIKKNEKRVSGKMGLKQFCNRIDEHVKLQVCSKTYVMFLNAPLLKQLKLPSVLYANFQVQPTKFHSLFTDRQVSEYFWYKSIDKINWKKIGQEYQYTTKDDDVGYFLKFCCVLYNKSKIKGPTVSIISDCQVENLAELPRCPFEDRHVHTIKKLKGKEYRIVSYNILADKYVTESQYEYCSPKALAVDYRKQLIFKELAGYNADIICLQEVDNSQFAQYYSEKFRELGYGGIYNRKGNRLPEGLASLYNKSRLKLVTSKHIVFSSYLLQNRMFKYLVEVVNKNKEVRDLFMRQATSMQVNIYSTHDNKKYFIVANTHLFYHPDAHHIRLLQANMATTYLNLMKKRRKDLDGVEPTVILCGDFNSTPDNSVYKYMTTGTINSNDESVMRILDNGKMLLYHKFILSSACGTPLYTNYTPDYKGCLDYIFIEKDKLDVLNVVPLISNEELEKYEGLPNEVFPSDHLALVVDVKEKF